MKYLNSLASIRRCGHKLVVFLYLGCGGLAFSQNVSTMATPPSVAVSDPSAFTVFQQEQHSLAQAMQALVAAGGDIPMYTGN